MKITFEGKTIGELLDQLQETLRALKPETKTTNIKNVAPAAGKAAQGPGPERLTLDELDPVDKPSALGALPVDKPKAERTEKQKANDERLRERALAKKAAGLKVGDKTPKAPKAAAPVEKPLPPPPATAESLGLEPAEVVSIRTKTISDLQEAYANGKQQEVFELLSRFGNGAKSFRELPPDAFVPIREAIDLGALT